MAQSSSLQAQLLIFCPLLLYPRALCQYLLSYPLICPFWGFSFFILSTASENSADPKNNECFQNLGATSSIPGQWGPLAYLQCVSIYCVCQKVRAGLDMMQRVFQKQDLLACNCLKFLFLLLPWEEGTVGVPNFGGRREGLRFFLTTFVMELSRIRVQDQE